ncbi:unnamed protein product [Hymenolepis diminuta]|uniref:Uncharacterized protein n=1 Tax=Hymenolepis diminuta TaxID=6216 RepID=A0A564Y257_HYMDI|nr:unnamed protein product [Hymenolepis diminuta]
MNGFTQLSNDAGWIFIDGNLRLFRIEYFYHPALGSSFRLKSSFLKSECEKHLLLVFSFTASFS